MKSTWRIFIDGLIKSFIVIALLLGVGVLSFHALKSMLHLPEVKEVSTEPAIKKLSITNASLDDISKNLIYCVDDEGKLDGIILEVFRCADRKLYYITIPVRTRLTMSEGLYRDLNAVNPSVPQMLPLSALASYFPKETVYEYGVLLAEELLNIKISYYTVVPKSLYDTVFKEEKSHKAGEQPKDVFTEEFIELIHTLNSEELIRNYIEELYYMIESNLTLENKLNYLESYSKLSMEGIIFELLKGESTNSAYIVRPEIVAEQLSTIASDSIK